MSDELVSLREILRRASNSSLGACNVFLRHGDPPTLETVCLLLGPDPDEHVDERGTPTRAVAKGFPNEGLQGAIVEDTAHWAAQFADPPSDELLLESYLYYREHDAFLPHPGAPQPPPWEQTQARLDREFYDMLGTERSDVTCQRAGCQRGAVSLSALCRVHHFESIKGRPSPFSD